MSSKAIHEVSAKELIRKYLQNENFIPNDTVSIKETTSFEDCLTSNPWLATERLVVKPDQLIKRRGKLGLLKVNTDWHGAKEWLTENRGREMKIGKSEGRLKTFIVEPFLSHKQEEECYICIYSQRGSDVILFHHEGGVDVGDVDAKAKSLFINLDKPVVAETVVKNLLTDYKGNKEVLAAFICALHQLYVNLYFTYLEINPLVVTDKGIHVLDVAAKLDQTAEFLCSTKWGNMTFPPPFGREAYPEEAHIADLDAKSGASLKLTVLNKKGRIWTMVAGGGASVVYSDTICELGGADELANYGEYSGAPNESQTFEYAKTILKLLTEGEPHPQGKILIIGGGIANFTNVSATFAGIVKALQTFKQKLIEHKTTIFVRRGGPNYQEGLRIMRELGQSLGVPMHVFGTETHMTAIVGMALGKTPIPTCEAFDSNAAASMFFDAPENPQPHQTECQKGASASSDQNINTVDKNGFVVVGSGSKEDPKRALFRQGTRAIIWGLQARAVQGMLDFDYVCSRAIPSVCAMVYPYSGNHKQKFYYGHKEIMIPVYRDMGESMKNHPDADIMVNFASLRSAYESSVEALKYPQIRTIAIIAEGIPERKTQLLNMQAKEKNVSIIGPATVGGIKPGCFKIGNMGGMLDNILASKLYRPGSIGYVTRSGGLANELNNIVARNTDGVNEGVAIGGDRYPGSSFVDHILRYEANPDINMVVLLGEVGGVDEYLVIDKIRSGEIKKPLVAWCIGTCAGVFSTEVQFGHANACANSEKETALSKNKAMKDAGIHVPDTFDNLGIEIKKVYSDLVSNGSLIPKPDIRPPTVPMDYSWAQELGLIRKPSSFISTICDERGQELLYAGMPISDVFKEKLGIGGTLALLWFQRKLPDYASSFIEICLMITADHGPAVSGAHNTIVTARAGKDLISSLCSGLLTIGDRFGGALDAAARQFSSAYDNGLTPMEFVNQMRKNGELIMGIGHRVKSINNPDRRVELLKDFVKSNFPTSSLTDYAMQVEKITTAKKPNLILNVDGIIGVAFVDLLRDCGCFSREEADEYVKIGALNGLFVLGRSIGFIGHFLDQKRLKQGLYRHPWDDITYMMPDHMHQHPAPFE